MGENDLLEGLDLVLQTHEIRNGLVAVRRMSMGTFFDN
jgi:hypothetical protein